MNVKQAYIDALNDLPSGIAGFLTTAIPEFEVIQSKPTTTDEAQIANGVLAYNVNLLLCAYSGLTLVPLLLRLGQHNTIFRHILLSGLEYIEKVQHSFEITSPTITGVYHAGEEIWFSAAPIDGAEELDRFTVYIQETDQFFTLEKMMGEGGGATDDRKSVIVSVGEIALPASFTAVFTAYFKDTDYAPTNRVLFDVQPAEEPQP